MDIVNRLFKGDKGIWIAFAFLAVISILEFFSSSSMLSYNSEDHWGPLSRHLLMLFIGFIVMVVTSFFSYPRMRFYLTYLLGILAIGLLIYATVLGKMGHGLLNGTSRWISVPFVGVTIQPSELVKLWLIVITASILCKNLSQKNDIKATIRLLLIAIVPISLILFENFSTAFLIIIVIGAMMIIGQINWKIFASIISLGILVLGLLYVGYKEFSSADTFKRVETWEARFKRFFENESIPPKEYDLTQENRQRGYASIAISSSGVIGVGMGNSTQREFISHAYSDLIYSIILEELGLIGGAFTVFLYILILVRVGKISNNLDDPYAVFFIQGVALMMALQALIHIFVSVDIIPITGQPLPIISKGGTSIVINCFELGLVLGISRMVENKGKTKEEAYVSEPNTLEAL